jgi:Ca2+-binding RTX toxin-like protein
VTVWKAALLTAFAFAVLPAGAMGATASLIDETTGVPCNPATEPCTLVYRAADGETNDVQASKVGQAVTIVDTGATITAGSGCTNISAQEVTCTPAALAFVDVGDLDDTVLLTSGANWIVSGGTENDAITLCAPCRAFSLAGGAGDDAIRGGNGDDHLIGAGGNDTLVSGIGRDVLTPGEGNDTVAAGSGRDTVNYEGFVQSAVVVDLRTGTAAGPGTDALLSVEDVIGTRFADRITGNNASNRLDGLGGNDLLVGKAGADVLVGGTFSDRLFGERGPDRLVGEGGTDLLVGGSEADLLLAGDGNDTLLTRDGVRDVLRGQRGRDRAHVDPGLDRASEIEVFF